MDARALPLVDLQIDELRALLAPVLGDGDIASFRRVDGGLVNTIYRVVPVGKQPPVALRMYATGLAAFEKERTLLERLASRLPVPEILLTGVEAADLPCPYVVYRWVEGITLNECRRQFGPAVLLSLAQPLGRLLAAVANVSLDERLAHTIGIPAALADADDRLRDGAARGRLGSALADALRDRLYVVALRLEEADRMRGLAHGDFGGRNVIVAPTDDGAWRIAALLDWEQAFSGATLWDVGSLFRYARRYSSTFRDRFELGYRSAGGVLQDDWHGIARLLDATRLVRILSEARELPVVFSECRELVDALVRENVT